MLHTVGSNKIHFNFSPGTKDFVSIFCCIVLTGVFYENLEELEEIWKTHRKYKSFSRNEAVRYISISNRYSLNLSQYHRCKCQSFFISLIHRFSSLLIDNNL
jgi:hypothetical protein